MLQNSVIISFDSLIYILWNEIFFYFPVSFADSRVNRKTFSAQKNPKVLYSDYILQAWFSADRFENECEFLALFTQGNVIKTFTGTSETWFHPKGARQNMKVKSQPKNGAQQAAHPCQHTANQGLFPSPLLR